MDYSGSATIEADRQAVWLALNNPEVLKRCIPGCTEFSGSAVDGFKATVTQKIGPVKATFRGEIALSDIVEAKSCTISGEGKGAAAGFAKGLAHVRLADAESGTELSYDVEARIGGKLAQIGSRLVTGAAKKVADQFFAKFREVVEEPQIEN